MRGVLRSVLLLAATATAVQAQNECLADLKMPAVGQWARYTGTMKNDPYTLRYAVVGAEEREGKAMRWLELTMGKSEQDQEMVYQVLTPGNPAEMGRAEEIVFKPAGKPAMKMNGAMLKMILGQLEKNSVLSSLCEGVAPTGEESVTVPAGTFTAIRYHDSKHDADTWVVPDRPFVMVKSKGKDFELNLAESGDGATSAITETPQQMP
jgi:hypothetical protein